MEITISDKKAIDEIIEKVVKEHLQQTGILRYVREVVVAEYHAWQNKHTHKCPECELILRVQKLEEQLSKIKTNK